MPPATTFTASHRVEYTVAATDKAARLKSLVGNGPLLVAEDHKLAKMLPEALDRTTHAPKVLITQWQLNKMMLGGALYDAAIINYELAKL